jgi:saccharopine dehydrogenase (NAD+, L-lysine forming)
MESPARILIIGAGGVGRVVVHKCAGLPQVFGDIHLASRTLPKCETIAAEVLERYGRVVPVHQVDADDSAAVAGLIRRVQPALVLNIALPYQDLAIMDACLETGVHYLDTANYEPPDTARFEYSWQWAYQERFAGAGLTALLGSGFDPGVTSVFTAHALKHHFAAIETLDIVDVNAGSHGLAFATNFNPEINIREITAPCRHWEDGRFIETPAMSMKTDFDCPEGVGTFKIYRMFHEELESLAKHVPGLKQARFWMSFSENYLKHLEVLQNVGMTSIEPIQFEGRPVVPLQFLKAVLPKPEELGARTKGKTCIGNIFTGTGKDGRPKTLYIYNICSHEAAFAETNAQAISYTTGVPAMIGAKMILEGHWRRAGVWNLEQLDPDPFMDDLNRHGLPWTDVELPANPLAGLA